MTATLGGRLGDISFWSKLIGHFLSPLPLPRLAYSQERGRGCP